MSGRDQAGEQARLGRALARAREQRGLSRADVARAINLRETVVRAIEQDDFTLCGGDVYARGHLRAYAKQVGLDPAPLLAAHAEQADPRPPGRTLVAERQPPVRSRTALRPLGLGSVEVPLERPGPNRALLVGLALAVVAAFLAVRLVGDLKAPARQTRPIAASPTTSPAPAPPTTSRPAVGSPPPTAPGTSPGTVTSPPSGVAVALTATGRSWVSVRAADGRTVFAGMLSAGQARQFSDDNGLRLTLGNAGAVQLTVNGKLMGPAGSQGEVVRLRFGRNDAA